MLVQSTNQHVSGGLSLEIDDRWIDGILDEILDWEPNLGSQPSILESLNFFAWNLPSPLSTFK
jgi:hypothetical protein